MKSFRSLFFEIQLHILINIKTTYALFLAIQNIYQTDFLVIEFLKRDQWSIRDFPGWVGEGDLRMCEN